TKAGVPMPERLKLLYDGLTEIIQEYKPDEASIEELFFNRNVTTAIGVGEARGIAMLACVEGGLSVSEYTPMQIKQALVGYGKAEKKQVQTMVKTILNLKEVPKPDDTADAVAAAICHAHSRNSRVIGR
ncbi:MAG: crossover junction endodeoxyribonuclease RuvC, partial [Mogibacterium diversum]|nr:crossover junction endodeoxyribonuclease RuvC [Mogibacterium diversum]